MANKQTTPPPAQGVRLQWQDVPSKVRAAVEERLGSPVVTVQSQPTGFSPGVAARLLTADGRRVFVKAVGREPNPDTAGIHRREAKIAALLPSTTPVPPLLWSYDDEADTGWIVLAFADIEGKHPAQPWQPDELKRVLDAMVAMSAALTPSPVAIGMVPTTSDHFVRDINGWQKLRQADAAQLDKLDAWSARHLDALAKVEAGVSAAVTGNTLVHMDIRADNMLLTPDQVWIVDWPHAAIGAAWVDMICFAPSVTMQGGPPPEDILAHHPASRTANPDDITAAVVATAGYFTYKALQPPPPGLPTVRAFQAAQGIVAREWVMQRTGWR